MFRVIKPFKDANDGNFRYNPGEEYPRSGLEVSKSRLNELSTANNRVGYPLIEFVVEEQKMAAKTEISIEKTIGEEVEEPKEVPKPKKTRKKKNAD